MCRSEFVPTLGGGRIVRTGTDLFHIFNLYPSLTGQMYDAHCRYFMIYYLLLLRKFRMPPLDFLLITPKLIDGIMLKGVITNLRRKSR